MTVFNFKIFCSLLGLSMFLLPDTALSMTAREGFVACDKNPKCKSFVEADGDVVFTGPGFTVDCPQEGQCTLIGGRTATKIGKKLRPAKAQDLSVKAQ